MSRSALLQRHDRIRVSARWLGFAGASLLALNLVPQSALATESTTPVAAPASTASDPVSSNSAAAAAVGATSDQTLLLEVDVNGQPIGKIGEFTLRRGKLMARPDELRDLGFRVPESRALGPHDLI
jgi:hypothetical protein